MLTLSTLLIAARGVGPRIGPDLGLVADRGFTPASLTATMWNHAPAMWVESKLRSVPQPVMNEQQAADLLAGKWYANVHTAQNPGGEIRGQMERAP